MSIDSMRVGGGRCPPFLVIGLSVVCIMMICNWWTLSSTNLELLHQIDELNEQIKISVEERDQCVTQIENSEKKLKTCQDKAVTSLVKSSQNEDLFNICNTELKSLKGNYESASATMEAMKIEIKTLKVKSEVDNKKKEKEVDQLKDELTKAKEEVEKLKLTINAPKLNKVPDLPAAHHQEKSQAENKTTAANVAPIPQENIQPNNVEPPIQDFQENSANKEDNAAEVNDQAEEMMSNLIPDVNNKPLKDSKK
ncbi:hypothetical protein TKK_0016359 [Trichogramma kaykai]|uniref:Golgi membrane protein 1 n=1 Tax=Trichogramma kaykai TaxID=54128 RepID=A0ABD2W882_9HYME